MSCSTSGAAAEANKTARNGRTFDISLRVLGLNLEGAVGVLEAEVVRPVLVDVVVLAHHLRRPSGGGLGGAAARAYHCACDPQLKDRLIHFQIFYPNFSTSINQLTDRKILISLARNCAIWRFITRSAVVAKDLISACLLTKSAARR